MPSLSFIKPPRWKAIVSHRTPFPAGRFDNISSPHPYAAPDVLDIQDGVESFESVPEPPPKPAVPPSPNIQIDIDLSSEPFDSDWFQTQFTASPSPPHQHHGVEGNGAGVGGSPSLGVAAKREPRSMSGEGLVDDEDDDVDVSTSEDDVLDHLKAMDGSTFLGLPPQSSHMIEPSFSSPSRRNVPTPIRIPSVHMHGPQVQIVRSAEAHNTRPLSDISSAESSAVSGQTLARALLGNSFVLSNDTRSSRYRSGFGGLVRSDSATLPRGDHPLMSSPYWRDRTLSGASDTFATDLNAPPVPANADKVYVPPQTPRHSGLEAKKRHNVRRHSSTGSLASPVSKDESSDSKSRPSSLNEFTREMEKIDRDIQALRRISRISEAPSSPSTTPANPSHDFPSSEPSPVEVSPEQTASSSLPSPSGPPNHSYTTSSNTRSPNQSTSSAKELDLLEYYASDSHPAFAPAFSPIIEESSSQLSSPGSRRLSQRGTPTSRTMSPLSGTLNGRIDLSTVRRPSDGAVIARTPSSRRRSIQVSSASTAPSTLQPSQIGSGRNASGSIQEPRASLVTPPPPGRVVGGRMRSGSAPSPIKIARDSRDLNAYKIISPLPENAGETPSTGSSNVIEMQQTFPETPNIFSPFWSPGTNSPGMVQGLPEGYDVTPLPQTPLSAALPQGRVPHASLDQQILLTRAATVVRARHSRQGSLTRPGPGARSLPKPQTPDLTPVPADATNQDEDGPTDGDQGEGPAQVVQLPPSKPSETSPVSSASLYSEPSQDPHPLYEEINTGFAVIEATIAAHPTSPSSLGSSHQLDYLRDEPSHSTSSVTTFGRSQSPFSNHLGSVPEFSNPFDNNSSPHSNQRTSAISPYSHYGQTPPPVVITPPAGESVSAPSPYPGHSLRRISEISHTMESPPPYDTIDHDQPPAITPSSSNSTGDPQFVADSAQPSPPVTHDSSSENLSLSRKTSIANRDRRARMRPTGPRRPLSHCQPGRIRNASVSSVNSPTSNPTAVSTRNPSTTQTPVIEHKALTINPPNFGDQLEPGPSSNGTTASVNNAPPPPSPKSPNFQVPPMPYRGLTMDQAKWTFTSTQLQTIVSRAIRQSAEASSIRLLRLDTLDNEIPLELERLEGQKAEIKGKYRSLTRASQSLFSKLSNQIASGSANSQKTVEELRDVTRRLNGLTEQLHSVDQQHAQIQNLVQLHSASALSMALRKLNASFLKQLTQTQELQRQVADLEDEITINELRSTKFSLENQVLHSQSRPQSQSYPPNQALMSQHAGVKSNSTEPPASSSPESEKKRSIHQVAIPRKPSSRYSRSIRWSGHHPSQRSSLSSNGGRTSMMFGGGASGTNSTFSVPPVPPLPRRRPTDINTDAPPTRSTTMLSTDDGTPNTEIRVQDELYRILGMSLQGNVRLKRSHSVIGLPGNLELQPHPSTTSTNFLQPPMAMLRVSRTESLDSVSPGSRGSRFNTRPLSYPASLLEAYNPLDADRNAMLATLEMISQDER